MSVSLLILQTFTSCLVFFWRVTPNGLANANYGFCFGDSTTLVSSNKPRGIFGDQCNIAIANISDGTSNMIAVSELCIGDSAQSIRGGVATNGAAPGDYFVTLSKMSVDDPLAGKATDEISELHASGKPVPEAVVLAIVDNTGRLFSPFFAPRS